MKDLMSGMQDILQSTSTRDFEHYTITTPVLSSWGTGWLEVMAREFYEPVEVEIVVLPAVSDIHLVHRMHNEMTALFLHNPCHSSSLSLATSLAISSNACTSGGVWSRLHAMAN